MANRYGSVDEFHIPVLLPERLFLSVKFIGVFEVVIRRVCQIVPGFSVREGFGEYADEAVVFFPLSEVEAIIPLTESEYAVGGSGAAVADVDQEAAIIFRENDVMLPLKRFHFGFGQRLMNIIAMGVGSEYPFPGRGSA
jgi:hypothetical protein